MTGSSYDANVTVEAKQRGAGTAGQFFSGIPAAQAVGVGETVNVIGLDQDGQGTDGVWRSNLAFVETAGQSASLNVERLDSAGQSLGMVPVSLRPREAKQLDLALLAINATPGSNQRIRVKVIAGPGRVIAAASHIDNRTGDPSTVEMAGMGSAGTYLCKVDKASLRHAGDTGDQQRDGSRRFEATVLITDEDVGTSCTGGELLRLAQTLSPPVAPGGRYVLVHGRRDRGRRRGHHGARGAASTGTAGSPARSRRRSPAPEAAPAPRSGRSWAPACADSATIRAAAGELSPVAARRAKQSRSVGCYSCRMTRMP
ncbi:MAG: hypothetical protein AB2L07_16745 [Thermoanaerobaculaceae bacterium]